MVELPRTVSPAAEVADAAASTRAVRPQRILVVDDNADARDLLQSTLDHAGHLAATAGNATEAAAVAASFQPDVGVLDIGLPGIDGYELARRLRDAHPGIKLIALTGYGQEADRHVARAAGFDAHCAKPVTTMALVELIDGLRNTDAA